MVRKFGFVPNGSRAYYLNRTQPPLLSEMVLAYFEETKDVEFLRKHVAILEKEYAFFMSHNDQTGGHAVFIKDKEGNQHVLNRYTAKANQPRPESYREDLGLLQETNFELNDEYLFSEIVAATESGWDFSSRWFADQYHMKTIDVTSIIPVDLNCIMYKFEKNMEFFYQQIQDSVNSDRFRQAHQKRKKAINTILYVPEENQWFDFHLKSGTHRKIIAASNFFPLWCECAEDYQLLPAVVTFKNSDLFQKGGVVGTTIYTRQQWDYPNSWSPLNWFLVMGLRNTKIKEAEELAEKIALTWIHSNLAGYKLSNFVMFEKYDVRVLGYRGFGGEYPIQEGFGWTNGTVLCFLQMYSDKLNYTHFIAEWKRDDQDYIQNGVIQELKNMFNVTKGEIKEILRNMNEEMTKGLASKFSKQNDGLKMIPTFIMREKPSGREEGFYVTLDFGGTFFIIWKVELKSGRIHSVCEKKFTIPDEIKHSTASILFDWIVNCTKKELSEEEMKRMNGLGLTFSFPIQQRGLVSGYLINWTKGFTVKDVEGQDVVKLMNEAFQRNGLRQLKIDILINNTVATQFCRYFRDPQCEIGVVVGAGTNLSYWEKVSHIPKLQHNSNGNLRGNHEEMIINTEWGGYNQLSKTQFDEMLDQNSTKPGEQIYEKMTSGTYLGELTRYLMIHLMEKKTIRTIPLLQIPGSFKTEFISRMLVDEHENLEDIKKLLREEFNFGSLLQERKKLKEVCRIVVQRAGRLIAAGIAAVAYRIGVLENCTIAFDGAVYELMEPFRRSIRGALKQLFDYNLNLRLELERGGSGLGCSLTLAVLNQKTN